MKQVIGSKNIMYLHIIRHKAHFNLSSVESHKLSQKDARRIQQWCNDLDVVTQREEWATQLRDNLQVLLVMIRNSDIQIYTFDHGIKKTVLFDKSNQQVSSLLRLSVIIEGVEYWLLSGLTLHGSETQKLNVNAYPDFTASNPYTITTNWSVTNFFRHKQWNLPPSEWRRAPKHEHEPLQEPPEWWQPPDLEKEKRDYETTQAALRKIKSKNFDHTAPWRPPEHYKRLGFA